MDVGAWLDGLGLGEYAKAFADNHIDAAALPSLTADHLKELGVASLGHRLRLQAAIAALPRPGSAGTGPEPPAAERRQVTIMFADLCGFTALTRALDVEDVHDLIGRFTALVDRIVEAYGGSVDKHVGDAVMALFGAPVAHGDDPTRAVRAALDIHRAIGELGTAVGRTLEAHIGIADGEVVAGALARAGRSEYTVLGNSVNLAARLQAIAGPGETVIGDTVRTALSGAAECDDLGALSLKGFDRPTRAWRVRALASLPPSYRAPFVGRAAELGQFEGMLDACRAGGAGRTIVLRGEPGIGKTRLLGELMRLAAARGFDIYRASVLDFGLGAGRDPIRGLLGSLLGIGRDGPSAELAAERAVADRLVTADEALFLNDLLGLPLTLAQRGLYDAMDHTARLGGKRTLIAALVGRVAARRPALLAVEDIHWADPATLAYLARIAATVGDAPALLVMTTRAEGDPIDPDWRGLAAGAPVTTIELGPLRRDEALALAGALADLARPAASACVERAAGNPLFLEQLLRNSEEGALEALPGSIQSLVLARTDRLPRADKEALQAAAVIGQKFELATLRALLAAPGYDAAPLIRHGLVHPDGAGYLFAHALIRDGVYAALVKARRRALHLRAADWFASRDPVLRAQHLDRAGDEAAAAAYCAAAEAEREEYRYERALTLAERGLALARDAAGRHALLCLTGRLLEDIGRVVPSIDAYRAALETAPDDAARCRAAIGVASAMRVADRVDEALAMLDQAGAIAAAVPAAERAQLHSLRGNLYFPLGRIEDCRVEHERALSLAREAGSPAAEARALSGVADAAYAQGRMRTAFEHFRDCVDMARRHGLGRIEVANRSMIGFSRHYLNQIGAALEDGLEAARLAAKVGHPRAEILGETLVFVALYESGELDRAEPYIEHVRALCRSIGATRFEGQIFEFEARLRAAEGRLDEARRLAATGLGLSREAGLNFSTPRATGLMALLTEDPAERARLLAAGEALLRAGAVGHNHLWFYRDAIEAALASGDWSAAERFAAALDAYTAPEPLPWSTLIAALGRARAAAGSGRADAALAAELSRLRLEAEAAGLRSLVSRVGAMAAAPDRDPATLAAGGA